ncbi:hypothetical protein BCR41DRAFT_375227 [Lobosporangium transversale]|uniref:Uncharacterized protein n=1 Tax=Lobosporangium transversale TaxID=64571 RepID=A0A1Y2G7Q0_9FUNG|nr:hypothetical protein BCR41DRAFT_375227 [Lobosporangium transversale]ORZ01835.1 hypothetical protein BCR41DRAFT_375227 [Lobosporangium transversale]|eukprot:XP_021876132.1 hypothetical protein BCR41DRAFT_375227 [Lobosporangium transversale]
MASAFIGLSVKVLLTTGTSLKGHVADVDPITQRLMLQDVVIQYAEENTVRVMKSFSVAGGEIKDLQVLPTQPDTRSMTEGPTSPSPSLSSTSISTAINGASFKSQYPNQTHLHPEQTHATLVAPSPRQLPAHPHPSTVSVSSPKSGGSMPFHDPAIISAGSSISGMIYHDPAIISVRATLV